MHLVYLGVAWLVGLAVAPRIEVPLTVFFLIFPLALVVLVLRYPDPRPFFAFACICVFAVALLRYQHASAVLLQFRSDPLVDRFTNRVITGTVTADPITVNQTTSFSLRVEEVATGIERKRWPATIEVLTRVGEKISYGDTLRVEGRLSEPLLTEANDLRARRDISAVVYYGTVHRAGGGGGWPFLAGLYEQRHALAASLSDSLPAPEASLAQGLLIGGYTSMPFSVKEDFRRAGLLHIVAVSGFNMTLVAGIMLQLGTRWVGRRRASLLAAGAIVLFTIFWGFQASVLRAAFMTGLALLALQLGRRSDGLTALTFAAMIMTAFDPFVLEDVGFQLSFASTAGIILISPMVDHLLSQTWQIPATAFGWKFGDGLAESVAESMAVTIGALAATVPITALNFHNVSLIAPLANLLILPAVPAGMLVSAGQAFTGLVSPAAAHITAPVTWAVEHYVVSLAGLVAQMPFAAINVGGLEAPVAAMGYGLVAALIWMSAKSSHGTAPSRQLEPRQLASSHRFMGIRLRWVALSGSILVFAAPWSQFGAAKSLDRAIFLNVGQGDAILIHTAAGHNILIDGGPSPDRLRKELDLQLPFWERRLDLVVATHGHSDHLGGLSEVLLRYPVGQVVDSGFECESDTCKDWRQLILAKQIPYTTASAGENIPLSQGSRLEVLYPYDMPTMSNDGENGPSLVLRFVSGDVAMLLTGDVDIVGQTEIVANGNQLESQILKLPHHGAKDSLSPNFLDSVRPEVALISVGTNNLFGHPAPETLEMLGGELILRTDQHGTIEAITDGKRYWLRTSP